MKFKRRSRVPDEGVNLTPLIDVVFLLLIFFMVSTSFTRETRLNLSLPEAEKSAQLEEFQGIEIAISADAHYRVNGNLLREQTVAEIQSAVRPLLAGAAQTEVLITADGNAPHQSVVRAMDAVGQLGLMKISIATKESNTGE